MSNKTAQQLVEEAKAPGTFSIIDAITDRAYPKIDVPVYLNEQIAYEASLLNDKLKELQKKVFSDSVAAEIEKVEAELNKLTEQQKD